MTPRFVSIVFHDAAVAEATVTERNAAGDSVLFSVAVTPEIASALLAAIDAGRVKAAADRAAMLAAVEKARAGTASQLPAVATPDTHPDVAKAG